MLRPIIGLVSLVVLSACAPAMAERMAPTDSPAPVRLGASGSETVSFFRLIVSVPQGSTVGHHHDYLLKVQQYEHRWTSGLTEASADFRLAGSEVLREYGYSVLGGENVLFGQDDGSKARFQLGGTVTQLAFDTYAPLAGGYTEAVLEIEWQLLDTRSDAVVFTETTRGHGRTESAEGDALVPAFRDALLRLISDRGFVSLLQSTGPSPATAQETAVTVPRCSLPDPIALPDQMERAFRSVVVVRPGLTLGSGVVISAEGHVLTAEHVVSGLDRVPVRLRSGIEVDAEVVRVDPRQDVALLLLPGDRHECLPPAQERVAVGADLFAIGSPRSEELSYSVSRGVVSGYRVLESGQFLQTDASLNPGNSGGPALAPDGTVLGVVSWKLTGGSEGLSFAVPVDVAFAALGVTFR